VTLAELAFAVPDDTPDAQRRGQKSDTAYRTISEVATDLNLPQHVLRFWESKFKQISPLKRGGGRRYYRPQDIELIRRIHYLLHIQGYTIKGVQKLLAKDRNLQQSVPMLLEGDSARVVVANALQRTTSQEGIAQQDLFPSESAGSVTRQTDLKLLLDKLKLLRTQLDAKEDAEAARC
jgi:DNA-binding transcriptional MerR regulator